MRTSTIIGGLLAIALAATPPLLRGEESLQDRIARIEAMSANEKAELAQKKKRFDELPVEEQERIRKLQAEIQERPDKEQLVSVMKNYHEWLKTLSANQRTTLRAKSEEERVDYIERIVADQQKAAWRKLAEQASPEDLETVFAWLTEFVRRHRDQLAPGEVGQRLAAMDEERETLILIHLMYASRFPGAVRPGREDVEKLIPLLSKAAETFYNETEDISRKVQLISIWARAAWWSKAFPNVTSEQLATFFAKLPAEERDRLEMLPPVERDAELRMLYARANFLRRGELGDRPWSGRGSRRGGQRASGQPSEQKVSPQNESQRRKRD